MTVFRQICILILLADISFTDKGTESRTGHKKSRTISPYPKEIVQREYKKGT